MKIIGSKATILRMTLRLALVAAVVTICFVPGVGKKGAHLNGDAYAATATATPVPEMELVLVPLMLAFVGRAGSKARRRAKAALKN